MFTNIKACQVVKVHLMDIFIRLPLLITLYLVNALELNFDYFIALKIIKKVIKNIILYCALRAHIRKIHMYIHTHKSYLIEMYKS